SLAIICFGLAAPVFCAAAEGDAPFREILDRYRTILLAETIPPADVISDHIKSLSPTGQWPDIDYQGKSTSGWVVLEHIQRINTLARAYASPSHALYRKSELHQTIHQSLDHWLDRRYRNSNWWYNEIGVPREMRDIIVLLGDDM